ncbi:MULTISPECIES: contact-dependent growth inhibition system immunity protein [Enterobacterales]|nr:contact-dependent growth inhibition system immunity protein [Buttiauxella sp. S19-1]ELI7922614.1 hypothetical protein [Yersinia enterocolitica]
MQFENITYLLGAYFHQDWFYDAPTSDEVIKYFVSRESSEKTLKLKQELTELLSCGGELSQEFISDRNGYYDPAADELTVKEWLERILFLLSSHVK